MSSAQLIEPGALLAGTTAVLFDCRFSLAEPQAGRRLYEQGHIPGAHYLDLNRDLAGQEAEHGGRHPLPSPITFAATLARYGVGLHTDVVAYDDSRQGFAARLWWLMRSLGYRPPRLLDGGYAGFLQSGGRSESDVPAAAACAAPAVSVYTGLCDLEGLRRAQARGALLVDSREPRRYAGLEEPIDPVAGHIPGAINRPWQGVTDENGKVLGLAAQRAHWGEACDAGEMVVYCGSGVTACANLFSLAMTGREDAVLYSGSWSDWCSYL